MEMREISVAVFMVAVVISSGCVQTSGQSGFIKGTYDSAPTDNGTILVDELIGMIKAANSNTYNVVMFRYSDFDSLDELLTKADEEGIDVWVTLLPPSTAGDERLTDYVGLSKRIARLSVEHGNLKAWSIDNVIIDYATFTPDYLKDITTEAKKINPDLKFIPVVYYGNIESPYFSERAGYLDGIQFYYMNFPVGYTDESDVLLPQLEKVRENFDGEVILGIYATPWSKSYPTSAYYVKQLINLAKQHTDGVMIYTLKQEGEKLETIRSAFGD